jgi:hypothetical protein
MYSIIGGCVWLAFFLLIQHQVRKSHWIWTVGLFGLLPVICTPYWLNVNQFDAFLWLKIYSMMLCICWATWLSCRAGNVSKPLQLTIPILLIINVLEATLVDIWSQGFAHQLNGIAGVGLVFLLPKGAKQVSVDRQNGNRDLLVSLNRSWIVGYTLWNWTFVYLNYPEWSGHHTAVLGSALIIGWMDPKRWVQARACTLGISLLLTATCYEKTLSVWNTEHWFDSKWAVIAAIVSAGWIILLTHLSWTTSYFERKGLRINDLSNYQRTSTHLRSRWLTTMDSQSKIS